HPDCATRVFRPHTRITTSVPITYRTRNRARCRTSRWKRCSEGPASPVGMRGRDKEYDVTYIIAQPCVDVLDKGCIDECPVDCIYEGERMLYIHPDECVDCGACEPVCPVEAIYYEDDLPARRSDVFGRRGEPLHGLGWSCRASQGGSGDCEPPPPAHLPREAQPGATQACRARWT